MNRKLTPVLLSLVLALILLAYLVERNNPADRPSAGGRPRILEVDESEIIRLRIKRDYWNSYALQRNPGGGWQLLEPSNEPAATPAAEHLVRAVAALPALRAIDLPAGNAERYREYGLWTPATELTVTTSAGDQTLLFGGHTPDQTGVYCLISGRSRVYVTAAADADAVAIDPATLRAVGETTFKPIAH